MWDEEIDPEWSMNDLLEGTDAGRAAKQHANRASGDEHEVMVHVAYDANPWVAEDHDVLEVRGVITGWTFDTDENEGTIEVKSFDGETYEARIPDRQRATTSIRHHYGTNYSKRMDIIRDEQERIAEECKTPAVFRIVQGDPNVLFGTVTEKYEPVEVEDLKEALEERLADAEFRISKESSGTHGGVLDINLDEEGPADVWIQVNAGHKHGLESATASGRAEILACKNQMTMGVDSLVENIPRFSMEKSARHLPGSIAEFTDELASLKDVLEDFQELTESAKDRELSEEEVRQILAFYIARNRISNRTRDLVYEAWGEDELTQEPGTLYGLAMASTWVGTHGELPSGKELSDGVKRELQEIGGELLIVSGSYEEYFDVVQEYQPEEEEAEAEA